MTNTRILSFGRFASAWSLCIPLLLGACGRTPLLPPWCTLESNPSALDFGEVSPDGQATRTLDIANRGGSTCHISGLGLDPSSDPWFALGPQVATALVVKPGEHSTVDVTFAPAIAALPLDRAGALVFATDDPSRARVEVPLAGRVLTHCTLAIAPKAIDFGHVALGNTLDNAPNVSVEIANVGDGSCEIGAVAIAKGSDAEFSLGPQQENLFTLAPGETRDIVVVFYAVDPSAPYQRNGQLTFETTDPKQATEVIPLSAYIDVGCSLTISPASLDFGNVMLNTAAAASVTLGNDGSDTCQVSGIALGLGTDAAFTLDPGQALAFAVDPGASRPILVHFSASDSAPPHLKKGTLIFKTGNTRMPDASISLSGYVNSVCVEASQWIYTVDQDGTFSRFDPATSTFTDIGSLNCPSFYASPFSMAVDQNAVAWVTYNDGSLFKVDTATGQCRPTGFQAGQHGLSNFGMGFVFDPSTGLDTLYIAGGSLGGSGTQSELATVSFPSLAVTPV
ncbi:MAG TPA: choice-of-anchor D domain-containing protein, partial [Polyangia bacterium]